MREERSLAQQVWAAAFALPPLAIQFHSRVAVNPIPLGPLVDSRDALLTPNKQTATATSQPDAIGE